MYTLQFYGNSVHFYEQKNKIVTNQNVITVILRPCELILVNCGLFYANFTAWRFLTIFLLVRPLGLLDTPDVWEHFSKLNWSNKKTWTFLWSPDMWKTFEDHNSWNKIFEFYRLGNHAKTVCSAKENSSRNSTLKHFTQKALTTNSSTKNSCKFLAI